MPTTTNPGRAPKKRKQRSSSSQEGTDRPKKPRAEEPQLESPAHLPQPQPQSQQHTLIAPHEAIVAELESKYQVLTASVISSTQIRKRVSHATAHLIGEGPLPRLVLLHARPADVCKLITVAEQCKRTLGEQGKTWYQYNQLFDLPKRERDKSIVEETALEKGETEDSESDAFESMNTRFEKAVMPPEPARATRSLRVIISLVSIPQLRSKPNITIQSSEGK